jgi:hypothetical protein
MKTAPTIARAAARIKETPSASVRLGVGQIGDGLVIGWQAGPGANLGGMAGSVGDALFSSLMGSNAGTLDINPGGGQFGGSGVVSANGSMGGGGRSYSGSASVDFSPQGSQSGMPFGRNSGGGGDPSSDDEGDDDDSTSGAPESTQDTTSQDTTSQDTSTTGPTVPDDGSGDTSTTQTVVIPDIWIYDDNSTDDSATVTTTTDDGGGPGDTDIAVGGTGLAAAVIGLVTAPEVTVPAAISFWLTAGGSILTIDHGMSENQKSGGGGPKEDNQDPDGGSGTSRRSPGSPRESQSTPNPDGSSPSGPKSRSLQPNPDGPGTGTPHSFSMRSTVRVGARMLNVTGLVAGGRAGLLVVTA